MTEAPSFEKVEYAGWPNSYRLFNRLLELVCLSDVGPRIIRFGFIGEENELREFPDLPRRNNSGRDVRKGWQVYGGHRLWHAPEDLVRTYCPDNDTVHAEIQGETLQLTQPVEERTGIRKRLRVSIHPLEPSAEITHQLRNDGLWTVRLAPWAPTLMQQGGRAILPFPPKGSHSRDRLPNTTIVLWPYTEMTDPRFTWGNRYLLVTQNPEMSKPQKVGLRDTSGWCAYLRDNHLFVKRFTCLPTAEYPDLGSTVTIFINHESLELETMGPLTMLEPGETVEYRERWWLFKGVETPNDEMEIDQHLLPFIRRTDPTAALEATIPFK